MFDELLKYNSKVIPLLISKKTGTEGSILQEVAKDSDNFVKLHSGDLENNKGLHICLHTDADGDPKLVSSGITTYFFAAGGMGEKLARNIHRRMLKLFGLPDRGCTARPGLYELKNTIASAVLVEMGFHDEIRDSRLIHSNMQQAANELVLAAYETLELPFAVKRTWIEIINESTLNDKTGWIDDIPAIIKASIANGDSGAFESLKYFTEFIESIGNK